MLLGYDFLYYIQKYHEFELNFRGKLIKNAIIKGNVSNAHPKVFIFTPK